MRVHKTMKRTLTLFLALVMLFSLAPAAFAEGEEGLGNFQTSATYTDGRFSDVKAGDWFADSVKSAYELGLMNGTSDTTFNPSGEIYITEVLTLASRIHSIYSGDGADFSGGDPWYQPYIDYAIEQKIIKSDEYNTYLKKATRANFANIIYAALPAAAWSKINNVDKLPDVKKTDWFGTPVFALYNAGILTGSDEYGTFNPSNNIQRSEVAAIVTRIALQSMRKTVTLKKIEVPTVTLYAWDGRTIEVEEDEVAAKLAEGWTKERDWRQVYIEKTEFGAPSGGASNVSITVRNHSGKGIKQISYRYCAYDANGKVIESKYAGEEGFEYYYKTYSTPVKSGDKDVIVDRFYSSSKIDKLGYVAITSVTYDDGTNAVVLFNQHGQSYIVPEAQVENARKDGWMYITEYFRGEADRIANGGKNNKEAFLYLAYVRSDLNDSKVAMNYSALSEKAKAFLDAEYKKTGCPVMVLDTEMSENSIGTPEVDIMLINISPKTIARIDLQFTCLDAYGKPTSDYGSYGSSTFKGYANNLSLVPYDSDVYTWSLYSNEQTAKISNLKITGVAFSDGTSWGTH